MCSQTSYHLLCFRGSACVSFHMYRHVESKKQQQHVPRVEGWRGSLMANSVSADNNRSSPCASSLNFWYEQRRRDRLHEDNGRMTPSTREKPTYWRLRSCRGGFQAEKLTADFCLEGSGSNRFADALVRIRIRGGHTGRPHDPAPRCAWTYSWAECRDGEYLCGLPRWKTQMGYPCSRSLSHSKRMTTGPALQAAFRHLFNLGPLSPSSLGSRIESSRFASLCLSFRQWAEWQ